MASLNGVDVTQLRACLGPILSGQPVMLAYLYGSAARGQMTPFSDVDIALVVDETLPADGRLDFELRIADQIAEHCGLSQADVRVINEAPLMFRGMVVTEGVLLYTRDDYVRIEFETHTRQEYFDFMPVAEMFRKAFFERVRLKGLNG